MLIEPARGSAAFWIGKKSNGKTESVSSHGGCPVLMGSKWILNKWIHYFDQWKTYPCLTDEKAYVPPFNKYYR
jgi:prolyl 4-hydroxylase